MSEQTQQAPAEPLTQTQTADLEELAEGAPRVGIIMGSKSDMDEMEKAGKVLDEAGPDKMAVAEAWTQTAESMAAFVRPDELDQALGCPYGCRRRPSPVTVNFVASTPGTFFYFCTIVCGSFTAKRNSGEV